jgi:hypothetical protein
LWFGCFSIGINHFHANNEYLMKLTGLFMLAAAVQAAEEGAKEPAGVTSCMTGQSNMKSTAKACGFTAPACMAYSYTVGGTNTYYQLCGVKDWDCAKYKATYAASDSVSEWKCAECTENDCNDKTGGSDENFSGASSTGVSLAASAVLALAATALAV